MKPAHSWLVTAAADMWQVEVDRVIEEERDGRHVVFVGMPWSDGGPLLIKASTELEESVKLENEERTYQFLQSFLPRARFRVPSASTIRRENGTSAVAFEYIEADWFASKRETPHMTREMSDFDLDDVAELMILLHALPKNRIPGFFQERADNEFSDEHYFEKLSAYLQPVIEAGHISEDEGAALHEMALGQRIVRRFVHHDIVPWNLARDANGKLVLIHGKFARWGMAYYDFAYFYLQTRIMIGDVRLAERGLERAAVLMEDDDWFKEGIWVPLAYRLGANLWVALQYPEQMPRALDVLKLVLKRDFDGLLR